MILDFATLELLLQSHPAWRLLCSDSCAKIGFAWIENALDRLKYD